MENHAIRVELEAYILKDPYKDRVRIHLKLPLRVSPFMLGV
jgi:hypothetical protein